MKKDIKNNTNFEDFLWDFFDFNNKTEKIVKNYNYKKINSKKLLKKIINNHLDSDRIFDIEENLIYKNLKIYKKKHEEIFLYKKEKAVLKKKKKESLYNMIQKTLSCKTNFLFLNNNIQNNIKAGKLITSFAVSLILAISINILIPSISQKIIKVSDKIALYPYAKIIQKNIKAIEENNDQIVYKTVYKKILNKEIFSLYIKNNYKKLNLSFKNTDKIIIKKDDIEITVAGVSNEVNR